MELSKAIEKNISGKSYSTRKKPTIEHVIDIIDAAHHAPSPGNLQPLRFLIIEDQKMKNKIASACQQDFITSAPFLIVVCSDPSQLKRMYYERAEMYCHQYAGAAIENMLLKIIERGLTTHWVRAFSKETLHNCLTIPVTINIEAIIPVAYKSSLTKQESRKKTDVANLTYFHTWNNEYYKKPKMPHPTTP